MRSRACIAASVVETDSFLAMSIEAQILYIHVLFNADICGEVVGARRLARGYGLEDALDELLSEGYLLDVDGSIFDAYAWVNNKYTARSFERMDGCEPFQDGRLFFVGAEGKSAYSTVLQVGDNEATAKRHHSDNGATTERHQSDTENDTRQDKTKSMPMQQQVNTPSFSEPSDTHPCMCRKCGSTSATYSMTDGACFITCPTCGRYDYVKS